MVNNPLFLGLICHGGTCTMGAPVDWPLMKKDLGEDESILQGNIFHKKFANSPDPVILNLRMGVSLDPQSPKVSGT